MGASAATTHYLLRRICLLRTSRLISRKLPSGLATYPNSVDLSVKFSLPNIWPNHVHAQAGNKRGVGSFPAKGARRTLDGERGSAATSASAGDLAVLLAKLLLAFSSVAWLHDNVIDVSTAIGPSMQPLIGGDGDVLLLDKWSITKARFYANSRRRGSPLRKLSSFDSPVKEDQDCATAALKRGDVIVASVQDNVRVCKRIVALGGDIILLPKESLNSQRTIGGNGGADDGAAMLALQIPPGHVWIQGDNNRDSHDSRHYGPIPVTAVCGRVFFRIWPLHKAGSIGSFLDPNSISIQYLEKDGAAQ